MAKTSKNKIADKQTDVVEEVVVKEPVVIKDLTQVGSKSVVYHQDASMNMFLKNYFAK